MDRRHPAKLVSSAKWEFSPQLFQKSTLNPDQKQGDLRQLQLIDTGNCHLPGDWRVGARDGEKMKQQGHIA